MNFKTTAVALAVSLMAGSVQAQIANAEAQAKTNYLTPIGATAAWNRGITGKGSIIAIIDNGFDITHADIKANVLATKNFYKLDTPVTWGLHGTQMASIAAGIANGSGTVGVAPDAKLLLAQVGVGGLSPSVSLASAYTAMSWADSMGANVINLSMGSTYDTNFKNGTTMIAPGIYKANPAYTNYNAKTGTTTLASLYGTTVATVNAFATASKNAVIVASAGNSGTGYAQFPGAFATQVDANGNLLLGGRVLIVGNVMLDAKKNWVMNPTSNQAGSLCTTIVNDVCQDKYYVKDFYVVAPGSAILGAVPDAARSASGIKAGVTDGAGGVSGTSPAAALVSGGVALMHQAWPQLKASQLVQVVLNTATPLGDSNVYGKGMVNFDKATQPYADVKYSKAALTSGTPVGGASLATTTASFNTDSLRSSSVLANVQVVDGINRNFTANFTRAIGTSSPANSLSLNTSDAADEQCMV
jgi:subtilisin family serine protease